MGVRIKWSLRSGNWIAGRRIRVSVDSRAAVAIQAGIAVAIESRITVTVEGRITEAIKAVSIGKTIEADEAAVVEVATMAAVSAPAVPAVTPHQASGIHPTESGQDE